jgi:hypothetical protein
MVLWAIGSAIFFTAFFISLNFGYLHKLAPEYVNFLYLIPGVYACVTMTITFYFFFRLIRAFNKDLENGIEGAIKRGEKITFY